MDAATVLNLNNQRVNQCNLLSVTTTIQNQFKQMGTDEPVEMQVNQLANTLWMTL